MRRVLICEDSRTYAVGLSRLLERERTIDVVAVCESAEQAIERISALKPDLVTMDLELPGMSGEDAIEEIMSVVPVPILVISGHVEHRSHAAMSALAAGALDALPKSELDFRDPDSASAYAFRQRVKVLSGVKVIRHPRGRLRERGMLPLSVRTASAIGICASTGGPQALAAILGGVPATFAIPILVVQHISAGFTEGFASWLDGEVPLPVRLGYTGAKPGPGVWIAPEGAHMVLGGTGLELDERTPHGLHRPSGDILLSSIAAIAGSGAVAVVLTGMGRDGAEGVAEVQRAGGLTIVQDAETSAVFGMPRAAAEHGAELVLPLAEIAPHMCALRPPGLVS